MSPSLYMSAPGSDYGKGGMLFGEIVPLKYFSKGTGNYTVQMAIKISSNKQLVVAKLEWFGIIVTKQFFNSLRNVKYFLRNKFHSIKKIDSK